MPDTTLITDCRVCGAPSDAPSQDVLLEGGRIAAVAASAQKPACDTVIEAGGRLLAPGFIDVHIQGAGGADVLDATGEALRDVARICARFGVTGFLATTVFKPGQDNRHLQVAAEHVGKDLGGARLLGIHLEGPFISGGKRGMIQPDCICDPSPDVLNAILDACAGHLRMMTIAPELDGSLPLVGRLVDAGVVAALGHTMATYEQTLAGFDAGIDHVTHLFNAMPGIHHRAPGPLTAIFNSETVTVQLISDGVHVHPAVVKMTCDLLGPERIDIITDGIQALGLPDGGYTYNGVPYESKGGSARYKDGTLIGTAVGLSELVGRFVAYTDCSFEDAVACVSSNPAGVLGLGGSKGAIAAGMDADLVLLDADGSVHTTIVDGRVVYRK